MDIRRDNAGFSPNWKLDKVDGSLIWEPSTARHFKSFSRDRKLALNKGILTLINSNN